MATFEATLSNLAHEVSNAFVDYLPHLAIAIVVVLVGFFVAKAAQIISRFLLRRLKADSLASHLQRSGIEATGLLAAIIALIPRVLFFVVLAVFLQIALGEAGLNRLEYSVSKILAYVPAIVSAALVLVAGRLLGQWLGAAVTGAIRSSKIHFAKPMGNIISGGVLAVAVIIALAQLRIDTRLLDILLAVAFASITLSLAVSFSLGARDITRSILAGFYVRKHLEIGQTVEVSGHKGVLIAVDSTQTTLRNKGKDILLTNTLVFSETVQRSVD